MRLSRIINTIFTINNRNRNAVMYGWRESANRRIAAAYRAIEQGLQNLRTFSLLVSSMMLSKIPNNEMMDSEAI